MGYLGHLTKTAVAATIGAPNPYNAGGWVLAFDPGDIAIKVECEVYDIAIKGPLPSTFEVYTDTTFRAQVPRGDVNAYDGVPPIHLRPGTSLYLYYDTGAAPAPVATVFFRETSPI